MEKNEKGISAKDASNTDLKHELTMDNYKPNQNKFQFNSRSDLLESTKLSRLPECRQLNFIPDIPFPKAVAAVCAGCGGRLETDSEFQQSVKVCRKCLALYAKVDAAIDESAKHKKRELLKRFAEVK